MELTREQWLEALKCFYKQCFQFWLNSGCSIEESCSKAKAEAMSVKSYPFSPKLMPIPNDVKDEFNKIIVSL